MALQLFDLKSELAQPLVCAIKEVAQLPGLSKDKMEKTIGDILKSNNFDGPGFLLTNIAVTAMEVNVSKDCSASLGEIAKTLIQLPEFVDNVALSVIEKENMCNTNQQKILDN